MKKIKGIIKLGVIVLILIVLSVLIKYKGLSDDKKILRFVAASNDIDFENYNLIIVNSEDVGVFVQKIDYEKISVPLIFLIDDANEINTLDHKQLYYNQYIMEDDDYLLGYYFENASDSFVPIYQDKNLKEEDVLILFLEFIQERKKQEYQENKNIISKSFDGITYITPDINFFFISKSFSLQSKIIKRSKEIISQEELNLYAVTSETYKLDGFNAHYDFKLDLSNDQSKIFFFNPPSMKSDIISQQNIRIGASNIMLYQPVKITLEEGGLADTMIQYSIYPSRPSKISNTVLIFELIKNDKNSSQENIEALYQFGDKRIRVNLNQ
ncbi:MAG: hypothetical protein CVV02_06275 [Firmicutes bacterium HGW-Firmicutes-7]|nr:MAG: hypothetical protein CVV02_06275 [Firmicutes bacterium HGW-Firmicutes-7]